MLAYGSQNYLDIAAGFLFVYYCVCESPPIFGGGLFFMANSKSLQNEENLSLLHDIFSPEEKQKQAVSEKVFSFPCSLYTFLFSSGHIG